MTREFRNNLNKKKKELMSKFNSARERFEKIEKEKKQDLLEASRICNRLSERFKWWGSLP
ncbi:hypothetical protein KJ582_02370 [bacterium]|nr:hypothetical protein [bacterium]